MFLLEKYNEPSLGEIQCNKSSLEEIQCSEHTTLISSAIWCISALENTKQLQICICICILFVFVFVFVQYSQARVQWFHQTAGRQRTIPFVFFSSRFARLDGNLKAAAHRFKCEGWPSKKKRPTWTKIPTKKFCLRIVTTQHLATNHYCH